MGTGQSGGSDPPLPVTRGPGSQVTHVHSGGPWWPVAEMTADGPELVSLSVINQIPNWKQQLEELLIKINTLQMNL